MAKLNLDAEGRPLGYRLHYGKPAWFLNAWTTHEEAKRARNHERDRGRLATIVTHYHTGPSSSSRLTPLSVERRPKVVPYYAVYSTN